MPGIAQLDRTTGANSAQATTISYLLTDALGSVNATLNGVITANTFFYDPWGKRITATGATYSASNLDVTLGFTSQTHDDELGLINFKGRLYDPQLKRFTSVDPAYHKSAL